MSVENEKVCFNCQHCIRERDDETLYTRCYCDIDNYYIGYIECMEGWCKHWATDEKKWKEEK